MKKNIIFLFIVICTNLINAQKTQWTFTTDAEGWILGHSLTGNVSEGLYNLNITGADPYLFSPDNLKISTVNFGQFRIKLQNLTEDSDFQLFWTTTTDNTWSQTKSINFTVKKSDTQVSEYVISMLGVAAWTGAIKQLRLDVGNANTYGIVKIDQIDVELNPIEFGLNNGTIHLMQDLTRGGAISYISKAADTRNIVNIADEGRFIQQSYYAGNSLNRQSEGQSPSWSPWNWNPILVGDYARNRAAIINSSKTATSLYVKCTPMLWDMNNKPAEAIMEQWTTIDGNVIKVKNKLTCFRTDDLYGENVLRSQEIPAVYPISALKNLYSYFGSTPFTNATMDNPSVVNLSSGFWGTYNTVPEKWMAFVDDSQWGIGVYSPSATMFLAGMSGSAGAESTSGSTSYIAPLRKERLMKNSVLEYDYYLIIGSLSEIRGKIYQIKTTLTDVKNIKETKKAVYPNPVKYTLSLSVGKATLVKIFNANAQLVKECKVEPYQNSIDVAFLTQGIYFLRYNDGINMCESRFIKQ